jgi:PAS domain S-box-containing protein
MAQKNKTKEEFIEEIKLLQKRIKELETMDSGRKQQQQQQQQQQQDIMRLATIVRDSNDAIIMQGIDGQITAWNRGAELMYGYSEKEALGMNIERLTAPGKAAEHREFTRRLISGEAITSFETQRITKGGSILDVWLTVTKLLEDPADNIVSTGRDITMPIGIALIERNITERKKAEESLLQEHKQFQELFNHMSSGVAIYEAKDNGEDFIFKDINKSGERFSKVSRAEVVGKSVLRVFPGVKKMGLFEIFQQVWKTGEHQHYPVSLYKDERFYQWVENYVYKLPSGEIVAIYDDITERKLAENALIESEEKFRNIFNNATDGIILTDLENKKIYSVNNSMCQMVGYSLEELKKLDISDIHPKEDLVYVFEQIEKQSKDALASAKDLPIKRKDGSIFYASVRGTVVILSGKKYLLGIFRNITERKKMSDELRESERQWTITFNAISDSICLIDPDGKILKCNQATERLLGKPASELNGRFCYEIVHGLSQPIADCPILRMKETKQKESMPLQLGKQWFEVTVDPILDKEQRIVAAVHIMQDITEHKKAEELLISSNIILRTQQESSIDGMLVVNEKGEISSFNQRFVNMWDIPLDVIESRSDERAIQSVINKLATPEEFIRKVKHLYEAKDETSRDEVVLKDGRVLDRYSSPMLSAEGKYYGRVWYFRDITERKKMEEEIRKRLQELEVFYKASVGREERIVELKKKIAELEEKLKRV